ncbi:cytochrome c oxidase cbb3-type subunit 3 [Dyadobacter jejuensis]|uniref:Cytochrome c oxidase cbb3-type subunit 3 n=1 Tax=Dyadobacter jejuensis TaxID=1082580 RepID=A0A316ANE9_9BACT|nr:cbb3-type cytochrome c oxidase N-terminal domain-containing protein [Dyadobacter jejuensis]PWJ59253.1 cytochrome c oxidase cbb3-type subunit 3 [Dyadobacter jejuensis]
MKFRNYLETIAGIEVYPLISLVIFFVFFLGLLYYVFTMDKKSLDKMKNIPFDHPAAKSILSFFMVFIGTTAAMAQETEDLKRAMSGTDFLLYVVLGILFFITIMVMIVLYNALTVLSQIRNKGMAEGASKSLFSTSWWNNFTGIGVALSDEDKILIKDHDYDGIHELDNRMPPWLQSLFILTIIFAIIYSAYYFGGFGDMQIAELEKEVAQAEIEKKAYIEKVGASMDENSVTLLSADDPGLEGGKTIFTEKCAACHAVDGGGGVGPNLTDAYWLHGAGIKNIFTVIKYGVPEKGMISWEKQLSPTDIQKVASYIVTIAGTKPANPKEPQGELLEENGATLADSTVAQN